MQSGVQRHLLQLLLGRERCPRAHAAARGDAARGGAVRAAVRGEGRRGLSEREECARAPLDALVARSVEVMLQLVAHLQRAGGVEGGGEGRIGGWGAELRLGC